MNSLAFLSESAVRALLFALIGSVASWFLSRRGAEAQHSIWRTVLVAMLALPLLTMILPPLVVAVRFNPRTSWNLCASAARHIESAMSLPS